MSLKIVLIDSDVSFSTELRAELESVGFEIVETADGKTAIDLVREVRPDVIFLSVELTMGQSGYIICGRLKRDEELCHIPLVLAARDTSGFEQHQKLKARADAYLAKPFDAFTLIQTISLFQADAQVLQAEPEFQMVAEESFELVDPVFSANEAATDASFQHMFDGEQGEPMSMPEMSHQTQTSELLPDARVEAYAYAEVSEASAPFHEPAFEQIEQEAVEAPVAAEALPDVSEADLTAFEEAFSESAAADLASAPIDSSSFPMMEAMEAVEANALDGAAVVAEVIEMDEIIEAAPGLDVVDVLDAVLLDEAVVEAQAEADASPTEAPPLLDEAPLLASHDIFDAQPILEVEPASAWFEPISKATDIVAEVEVVTEAVEVAAEFETISEQLFETPILEAEVYAEASALPIAEPVAEADFLAEAPVFEAIAVAEEILEPLIAESALVVEPIADEPILEAELYGEASMLPIAESGAESGVDFVSSDFILDEAPALSPLPERPFSEPSPSHLPTTTPDVAMVEGEPHRLEQELDAAKAESEQAKAALDAAHAESEALKAERDAIRAELAAFRADFDTAKAESDQAKAERDAACAETEAAKAERDAIRAELAVFRTDFDTAKAESDQARAGFEAGRAETEALKAERDALQAQTEELEANLALSEERASKNYLKLRNDEQLRAKARKALDVALALLAATESVPIEPLPGERAQGDRAVKSLEELAIAATASANEAPQQAEGA